MTFNIFHYIWGPSFYLIELRFRIFKLKSDSIHGIHFIQLEAGYLVKKHLLKMC